MAKQASRRGGSSLRAAGRRRDFALVVRARADPAAEVVRGPPCILLTGACVRVQTPLSLPLRLPSSYRAFPRSISSLLPPSLPRSSIERASLPRRLTYIRGSARVRGRFFNGAPLGGRPSERAISSRPSLPPSLHRAHLFRRGSKRTPRELRAMGSHRRRRRRRRRRRCCFG